MLEQNSSCSTSLSCFHVTKLRAVKHLPLRVLQFLSFVTIFYLPHLLSCNKHFHRHMQKDRKFLHFVVNKFYAHREDFCGKNPQFLMKINSIRPTSEWIFLVNWTCLLNIYLDPNMFKRCHFYFLIDNTSSPYLRINSPLNFGYRYEHTLRNRALHIPLSDSNWRGLFSFHCT